MMKALITISCLLITFTFYGQVNDSDAYFRGNYNKSLIQKHCIRQVTVEISISGGKASMHHFEFNRNGLLTKQTVLDKNGRKMNDYLFIYNEHGDQIERKNIDYNLNSTHVTSFSKVYNGLNLIQETSSELPFITTYAYDPGGKKVQSTVLMTPDTAVCAKLISVYSYDESGKPIGIEEAFVEHKGSLPVNTGKTAFIYDAAGNITEIIKQEKAIYIFSYKTDGLLQSKTIRMPDEFSHLNTVEKYSYTFWQ